MGIPPASRGIPQIEVTFDIDANGIVNVSAKDLATGKRQFIRITASSGLSKEEINRLIRDADIHAGEDKKRKSLIEARNDADSIIYSTTKALKNAGGKIDSQTRTVITSYSIHYTKLYETGTMMSGYFLSYDAT